MLPNSLTAERRNKLAQILVAEGSVRIGEVAKMFAVSTETIRKDLIYLEKKGIARKSHGGAVATSEFLERPFASKSLENIEAKNKIAQAAVKLIPENGVIILDSGSTTLSIAKLLSLKKGLTVITNSVSAAQVLAGSEIKLHLTGGEVRGISMALAGLWTINSLSVIKADIAFLGSSGFESHNGPCAESFAEAETKKAMVKSCKKAVVVSDSSKFKSDALIEYATWEEIAILITDAGAPPEKVAELRRMTEVIITD
ncbi:DeoR/GlpR family DNA-binding transcription regulator [Moorella naiadis]|uniref:DeoR/GlpR family DNA-binding transcription regulator n=1 Tax=Moorella naiadis (nom. illeg.) TaxID=3093670 RepID=UPI003D9CAAEA